MLLSLNFIPKKPDIIKKQFTHTIEIAVTNVCNKPLSE